MSLRVHTRVLLGIAVPMLIAVGLMIAIAMISKEADTVRLAAIGGIGVALACLASGAVIAWNIGRDIDAASTRLQASSAQMAQLLGTQDHQTMERARVATEAAETMSRIEASARKFGDEAVRAADLAREALAMSEAGFRALEGMVGGLEALRGKAAEVSRETERLNQHTAEIGNITAIVGDLATRTTMLALNAAAEAARAGEHGKGFTNVAADVRKLADESQRSAERIAVLVGQIRESTKATIGLTEEEKATLRAAMELSEQTERQFAGISTMLQESYKGAQSISKTAERQHDAITRVLASIDSVRAGTKLSATGIHAARENVVQVEKATMRLQQMV